MIHRGKKGTFINWDDLKVQEIYIVEVLGDERSDWGLVGG
jgi:hypothetical protein